MLPRTLTVDSFRLSKDIPLAKALVSETPLLRFLSIFEVNVSL